MTIRLVSAMGLVFEPWAKKEPAGILYIVVATVYGLLGLMANH